jgi:hypothetical protein
VRGKRDRYPTYHLAALHVMTVEPGHSPAQEADRRGLLLVCKHLHVGEPRRVINGHMNTVVADAGRAALLPVTGDSVASLAKAGELFAVDMDQVSWMLPLVALDRRFRLQISQPLETKAVEHPGHGGEGSGQQPGDVPEVEALVTEIHGLLQLLWIERPTLAASNTVSIHQCGCPI